MPFITASDENDYYTALTIYITRANEVTLNFPFAVGHIIINEDIEKKEYFDYYFSKTKSRGKSTLVKPVGNYLFYYHENGYFTIDSTYEKHYIMQARTT